MTAGRKRRSKRCRFCRGLFCPDPRLKGKQYACSAPECQLERKRAKQRRWASRNPGYFKRRYHNTKEWLRSHPGYAARHRRDHPDQVERDNVARKKRHERARNARADIQVAKSLQAPVSKILTPVLTESGNAGIQVAILPQVIVASLFSSAYLERARAGIQGPIAWGSGACYGPAHEHDHEETPACGSSPQGPEVVQLAGSSTDSRRPPSSPPAGRDPPLLLPRPGR